ncbi:hypothetical protein KQI89_09285 [Clostridium sp. MSJ-4]|uniref:ATP-cone domain-containing protein n=1 Tax=Clostridium simiarum TaxID=2841506 RepID=A0ABS6F0E8_9CLOT|nr:MULTISPECIES: ATP cone domain-containing protein [Clostridium]MBU5591960.1 hypothetical protein [Clostridium simiarum]
MKVIKRSGNLEEFNEEKLKTSILNAASDAKSPLNQGDIKCIIKEICNEVNRIRNNKTSSYELFALTASVLKKHGFKKVVKEYVAFALEE